MNQWKAVLLILLFVLGLGTRICLLNSTTAFPQGVSQTAQLTSADTQGASSAAFEIIKMTRGKRRCQKDFTHAEGMGLPFAQLPSTVFPQARLFQIAQLPPDSYSPSLFSPPPSLFLI